MATGAGPLDVDRRPTDHLSSRWRPRVLSLPGRRPVVADRGGDGCTSPALDDVTGADMAVAGMILGYVGLVEALEAAIEGRPSR